MSNRRTGGKAPLVLWYAPGRPTDRQRAELQVLFGDRVKVEDCGPLRTAIAATERFRLSDATDLVAVAPKTRLFHLIECGVHPLYSLADPCNADDPEKDFETPDHRCFRFAGYLRLVNAEVIGTAAKALKGGASGPLRLGCVSRLPASPLWLDAVKKLYPGREIDLRSFEPATRSDRFEGRDVLRWRETINTDELIMVAPLPVWADVAAAGVHALWPEGETPGTIELRRVTAVEEKYLATKCFRCSVPMLGEVPMRDFMPVGDVFLCPGCWTAFSIETEDNITLTSVRLPGRGMKKVPVWPAS